MFNSKIVFIFVSLLNHKILAMLAKLKELGITKPINSDCAERTHFHGDKILATPKMLLELFGKPQHSENTGMDKVNFDWTLLIDGEAFTIYD